MAAATPDISSCRVVMDCQGDACCLPGVAAVTLGDAAEKKDTTLHPVAPPERSAQSRKHSINRHLGLLHCVVLFRTFKPLIKYVKIRVFYPQRMIR